MREIYERLVRQSGHWKVWVAWGLFEGNEIRVAADEDEEEEEESEDIVRPGDKELARSVFKRGYQDLKARDENDGVCFPDSLFFDEDADVMIATILVGCVVELGEGGRRGGGDQECTGDDAMEDREVEG